jgi:hypothetical protein
MLRGCLGKWVRKTGAKSQSDASKAEALTHRMKWSREKRSSSLFWMGVPVTAHRLRAFSE